jgi:CDP-glycerol glycerophosphotransferase
VTGLSGRVATSVRNAALVLVQAGLRMSLRLLSRVVPTTRQVVVSAFPETEGNAVEVALALLRRYRGRVVWLRELSGPHAQLPSHQSLAVIDKKSASGVWAYLRAETVFFTHGLYGSPRAARRKPLVNLWHGDGPKATRPGKGAGSRIPSTYLVSGTELFGELKAQAFEVPPHRLLITGNPRTDQFWRSPDPAAMVQLGITGEFVLWMPTFRSTRAVGGLRAWSEGGGASLEDAASLVAGLAERGIQLVVKPHPVDAEERSGEGVVTVTNDDLARAGVPLYSLIGRASGLVTDYSSVWVDFLLLDRPLAFWVPDRATYNRSLAPADVLDWLPGELVGDEEPFASFLADVDASGARDAVLRKEVATRIGLVQSRTSADDLLDRLDERGALRLVPPGSSTSLRERRNGRSSR